MADAVKGKIWSILDMTNSFFQTRVHPDDVHLTAVTTPFGLYEWLAMPMGLRNAPAIHQRRMISALRKYIGKICHIYLDDIIIWSESIEEHTEHIWLIMEALREANLHCNPRKCHFYQLEVDFLGHHIAQCGAEVSDSKVARILEWPVPKSATDVRAFLGLVRYIAVYLGGLAEYTRVLTPLTTKDATKHFPVWSEVHQEAFVGIKKLMTSRECTVSIDHDNPGDRKIFVTCDASEWRSGAMLSFGESWESARPVAFESAQFSGAELNYPVHEKELLAIVRALKKWCSDLLGTHIYVYTDHRTLENFETQRDLLRRQLRWQELMSQFDMTITYIRGEDNTVADALSRVPIDGFSTEQAEARLSKADVWSIDNQIGAVLSIATDISVLDAIKTGYKDDVFVQKLLHSGIAGVTVVNGLIYSGTRLVIPNVGDVRENLFQLAHDTLGHFGSDKSYMALRDCYYWPGMRKDLKKGYIPGCIDCQRNKSRTTKVAGPLHPLPIPENRCDSVAIDFVGPLPLEEGFDMICTMTCRLNSDVRIVPVHSKISAGDFAVVFFNKWYCENGLPLEIVCDRDKLFVSKMWWALLILMGIKMKMLSSYHPESDGSSERTNKTVNQSVRYHVERNQKGWVKALPRIRFDIMNTVNASTGFSGFQLKLGRSPRLIPPIVPSAMGALEFTDDGDKALAVTRQVWADITEAKDNLLAAKVAQTHASNMTRANEVVYKIGDLVMLSTFNRRRDYKRKGEKRVAKFMPRWDGPYKVMKTHPETSNYTLLLPNSPQTFPTFHASQIKVHVPNDDTMFPGRAHSKPGPIMTVDGLEEYFIDKIVEACRCGRGWRYLVRWVGYRTEEDCWLPGKELADCEALDVWLAANPGDS